MALLDPTNHGVTPRSADQGRTTKPILCLTAGFAFLIVTAVAFHFVFNALL